MTTYNRRDHTLACLATLRVALQEAGMEADLFLVDDGSRDGTPAAVREAWPSVRLIGGRDLFWCRGMHRAFAEALKTGYPAYLWLNDDTRLLPDALQRLRACAGTLRPRHTGGLIVVGSTADAAQRPSYGGQRVRSRWNRLSLRQVLPGDHVQPIDTMNGNVVWIDATAASRLGNLDPRFEHAMGDIDYGLRARAAGIALQLAPGLHGHCDPNDVQGTFCDRTLPLHQRLRRMFDRKGLPWRSWLHLTRRHGGAVWPLLFAWPYCRVTLDALVGAYAGRRLR